MNRNHILTQAYDIPELSGIYDKYFPVGKKPYRFVEIGANDGVAASKTIDLAMVYGWEGLYVEPIPFFANRCKELHARNSKVLVKELAISNFDGFLEIYNLGNVLCTSSEDALSVIKNSDWAKASVSQIRPENLIKAQCMTLTSFLEDLKIEDFDLLIVDVEGAEKQVFEGTNFQKVRPKMIIAELHEKSDYWHAHAANHAGNIAEIKSILTNNGYTQIFVNEWDSIFISSSL